MEKIITAALLATLTTMAGAETHHTTGVVTQAEYQQFVAAHKIAEMKSESLIETSSDKKIEREGTMLLVKPEARGAKLELSIKKEKEHGG